MAENTHKTEDALKLVGHFIGNYKVERFIDAGSYSLIYQAKNPEGEDFALKILEPGRYNSQACLEMSVHEANVLSDLCHANIIKCHGSGFIDKNGLKTHYLALEYFPYRDLEIKLNEGKTKDWDLQKKVNVVLSVSKALRYLHEMGIVHRDIKPSNILCNDKRIKLIDFFLARYTKRTNLNPRDEKSVIYGTPVFMAPEQLSEGQESFFSDIFSLGLVYYCLLTGQTDTYPGKSQESPSIADILAKRIVPSAQNNGSLQLPSELKHLIVGMTELKPESRPSASQVVFELENILGHRN